MPRESKRRIMRAFAIHEVSAVDDPAQEGARVAIMKRAEPGRPPRETKKVLADLLTSEEGGHQHGINVRLYDGELSVSVSWAGGPDDEGGHTHPIARDADGRYVLGTVAGHTHSIDQEAMSRAVLALVTKDSKGDDTMSDDLKKRLERAEAIIALNAGERAHFEKLDETGRTAFLAKSGDGRKAEIEATAKAVQDADPVVFTASDGTEYRKSAGEGVISMAKRMDAIAKENAVLKAERAQAALEKRAETELAHLPGDVKARAAMLKAIEGIEDETQRGAALKALKAQNAAMAKAFETLGHGGQPEPGSGEGELEKLAKAYAEKHSVTREVAMSEVLNTSEGAALYAKTLN